jgi:precorrin-2/cobalt-factor-2 C20-methyltransferase
VKTGTIWGLGIGPGDPELITIKALRLLQAAPVVAYPAPLGGESFARAIVQRWLDRGQDEIVIEVPMEVAPEPARAAYDQAAQRIARELDRGRDVAVLCQGDPFFYGSFMYLFGRLAGQYRVEIVPGVSSLTAAAAALQAPLAARNDVLAVLPGPLPEAELVRRLEDVDAAAIIKLGRHFIKVRTVLDQLGLIGRARYIERATLGEQKLLPLDAVDPAQVPYFSMILMHKRGEAWR